MPNSISKICLPITVLPVPQIVVSRALRSLVSGCRSTRVELADVMGGWCVKLGREDAVREVEGAPSARVRWMRFSGDSDGLDEEVVGEEGRVVEEEESSRYLIWIELQSCRIELSEIWECEWKVGLYYGGLGFSIFMSGKDDQARRKKWERLHNSCESILTYT
ncbi:immunoglobulin heavy chain V region [Sesbania bispinosa]|nr:immunoglobulin heavy chain V region [Sesbania bispinosa]